MFQRGEVENKVEIFTQQVYIKNILGDFPGGARKIKLHTPNAGGPGLIPGQGTRSHTHAATKSSHATTKEPTCRN